MGMAKPQFEVIEDDAPHNNVVDTGEDATSKAVDVLLFLLGPLSQKTVIAIGNLFSLLTVVSVFILSYTIIPHDPSTQQLVGLCGYAVFIVAVNLIVRRK
jgi:hypothetical protein